MSGYVTIVYTARGAPSHLSGAITLKGRRYATGEEVEVSPEAAGLLIDSAPKGSVSVVSGTPVHRAARPATAKAALAHREAHRKSFPADPGKALDSVPAIPSDVMEALGKKRGGKAFIESGAADACLADLALYLRLEGRHQLSRVAARRADALRG